MHLLPMPFQRMLPPEVAPAHIAVKLLRPMCLLMLDQIRRVGAAEVALVAFVRFLARVGAGMDGCQISHD